MNCAKHNDVVAEAYCRSCGTALCASCKRDVQGTIYCENCLAARINIPGATGAGAGVPPSPQAMPVGEGHPGLAAILGFIPGVGAMYNGQFTKGFIHVVIFASLIWLTDHGFPVGGLFIAAWVFYMVFDAYTTAKARRDGLPIPDPLGLNRMFGGNEGNVAQRVVATGEAIGEGVQSTVNSVRQNWQSPQGGSQQQQNPYQQSAYQQTPYAQPVEYVEPQPASRIPTGALILIGLGVLFLLQNVGVLGFNWVGRFWPIILIIIGVSLFIRRRNALRQ